MSNFFKFYKKYFFDFHHDFNKQYEKSISYLPNLYNDLDESLKFEFFKPNGPDPLRLTNIVKESWKNILNGIKPYLMALILLYGLNYIIPINALNLITQLGHVLTFCNVCWNIGNCYVFIIKDIINTRNNKNKPTKPGSFPDGFYGFLKGMILSYAKLLCNLLMETILPSKVYNSLVNFSNFIQLINKPVHFLWVGFLFLIESFKILLQSFTKKGKEHFARDVLSILREKVKLDKDLRHNNQSSKIEELLGFINDDHECKKIILSIIESPTVEQDGEDKVTDYIRSKINVA